MYFNSYEFGLRVQELRRSRGMTQEELAEALSVDKDHISRIERGVKNCSIDLLIAVACALHTSTDYLLMGRVSDRQDLKDQLLSVINELAIIAKQI